MSLRVQIQDSQGSGCRIDARTATLTVSQGILQIGKGHSCSFPSGELEGFQSGGSRHFGVGEGFASINEAGFSLVTDRYLEVSFPDDLPALPASGSVPACAVCEKKLTDTLHCVTINETPVNLCCPHCAESFRRATRIVRQAYSTGSPESGGN